MSDQFLTSFPWQTFFAVMSFTWGACMGSFLNVCVYRIPRELSVVKPRSFCPHCRKPIPWYLNIPLFSWLMLAGKCRYCGGRISARYFLVELLTAVLFLMVWLKFSLSGEPTPMHLVPITDWKLVPVYWLVVFGLVLGTFVDFEHLIIPDRVTIGGIIAGLALSILLPVIHGEKGMWMGLVMSFIGAASGWGILWAIAVLGKMAFKKDAMGFGDVKLLAAIGAFFGWRSVLFTLMLSSLAGSVVGISLVLMKQRRMGSRIPYGPYIALAALIWMFWGPALWSGYIDLITPKQQEMIQVLP